jgi:hypothetical protein
MQPEPYSTVDLGAFPTIDLRDINPVDLGLTAPVDLGESKPAAELPYEPIAADGRLQVEADCEAELNEAQLRFKGIFTKQRESFVNATDSGYFVCVCFQNRAQLVEWLSKSNLNQELDGQYLDGRKLAERMNIKITAPGMRLPRRKQDPKLIALCGD